MSTIMHKLTTHERSYVLTRASRAQQRNLIIDWSLLVLTFVPAVLRFVLESRQQQTICIIAASAFAILYIGWRIWLFTQRRHSARGALGEMAMRLEVDLENLLDDLDLAVTKRRDMTLSFLGNVRYPRRRNARNTTVAFPSALVSSYQKPVSVALESTRTQTLAIEA